MKRATTKLISYSKISSSSSSSCNFTTKISSSSISTDPIQNSCTNHNLKPCSNSNGLMYKPYKTQQLPKNPSQNYSTYVEITPYFHSKQRKNNTHVGITPYFPSKQKKMGKIKEFFEAAKSAEEMLEIFKEMEANLDEGDIGFACIQIAHQLDQEGKDPEKIVSFANRALSIFDQQGENDVFVAVTLELLGSAYYSLRKANDALECLNRANKILLKLENDGRYGDKFIKTRLYAVQIELASAHFAVGRSKEAGDNLRKSLEIKAALTGENSREVGNTNREFAKTFAGGKKFKEGLPYCLKALEIHLALLGENSVEVAQDRRLLEVIYAGMKEYEKALKENRLAQKVFKNCGCTSDWVRAGIDGANMHITLGMYEAAMNTLNEIIQDSEDRTHILITMGKVLVHQEKFADAKRCLEIASSLLDKKAKSKPLEISDAYIEISVEYETMNEFENAISFCKKSLALLEMLPDKQHLQGMVLGRIGRLLLLTGKVTQAMPYLESAVETVKESFMSKHFVGGYIYNNLGVAYLELKRPQSAAQMFAAAKDIMDASSLGPHHNDSIQACQNLSKAYAAMKSYPLAIEFQQKAVDAWEGNGSSEEDRLMEARQLLEQLKAIALGASSKEYPTKALPLPYSRAASRGLQVPQPSSPK